MLKKSPNFIMKDPRDDPQDLRRAKDDGDPESNSLEEDIPYPKSVFFIVSNEFCERFCFYGMRTILSLYLVKALLYSESDAKIIYHTFIMFVYFFPILGAIISDSFLGKFRTIFYVSIIYAIGNMVLSVAAVGSLNLDQRALSMMGLLLIALGTGGIKPCVAAFGGDQFVLPQQEPQLAKFFSMFYFAINAGSLISTFLTPLLREDVSCFGNEHCFPLAFAVPGLLMIVSIVIFGLGRPLYNIRKPEGNIVLKVASCIGHAVKKKVGSRQKVDHWLDHAEERYGRGLVGDVKATLKVLMLYVPLPIFWALYDQQGSGWTFQAVRMNGHLGFYTILPDQMQVVNPLLILAFIPIFTYGVYPAFAKCNLLRSPLQRMICGGLLTALAFGMSALLSLALETTYPVLPTAGNAQIRIYNTLDCNATFKQSLGPDITVPAFDVYKNIDVSVKDLRSFSVNAIRGCDKYKGPQERHFIITEKNAFGFYLTENNFSMFLDNVDKDKNGYPRFRTLVANGRDDYNLKYIGSETVNISSTNTTQISVKPGTYKLENTKEEFQLKLGGVYTVLLNLADEKPDRIELIQVTEPNSVHMLWLLPQYIVITAGEIMFSITGLEFSYSQAPVSMKSVLQAAFLLTTAVGNLIIVIIESAKIFEKQSSDFFLYTALMVIDMLLFAFMAMKYKYVTMTDETNEEMDGKVEPRSRKGSENPAFTLVNESL